MSFNFGTVIPRDRDVYIATDHLMGRVRMKGRFITEELVRRLIEEGELKGNRPGQGGWVFEDRYDGVSIRLICDIGADLEPRIVTGVSKIMDEQTAKDSDRWGEITVRQVKLRTLLSEANNRVDKQDLLDIECLHPIDVKGHSIMTEAGDDHVECVSCGLKTRAKSELAGTPCE